MTCIKLLFLVVLYLFAAAVVVYAGRSRLPVEKVENLNHSNKAPVRSIKSPDGDIIDCVHITHQPSLNHPLLKNHTIKMRPSYYPNWMKDDDIKVSSMKNATKVGQKGIAQLWHSSGECPKGTIPIRRTTKEDPSVERYHNKKGYFVPQPSSNDSKLHTESVTTGHEYAIANFQGKFYGSKATLNVWNPVTEENGEFSLTQLWLTAGPQSHTNSIEAGWQVFPGKYGDTNTRLFIFWTNDGYHNNACYNLDCAGFIQLHNKILLGGSISPTSQVDGSQYEITIFAWRDPKDGNWWLQVGNEVVGYWPATLFSYLNEGATMLEWGGEIINEYLNGYHTSTQMGSGYFAEEGFEKASYIKNIQAVDESMILRTPGIYFNTFATNKNCYDIILGNNDDSGASFYYGGPGRNQQCM